MIYEYVNFFFRAKKLYKTGPPCQSWKDCTAYKKSFCYHDTNLCDYDGTEEVHDSFHVFLASNGTISISNLGIKLAEIKF